MSATEIFRIDFDAHLDSYAAHVLAAGTGMFVSDLDNPDADVVGSQFIGEKNERVVVALSRIGAQRWRLEAFTHAPSWDMNLMTAYHAAADAVITQIRTPQNQ